MDEFLTGTSSLQACDLCALHKVNTPPFQKKKNLAWQTPPTLSPPSHPSSRKTSIMWPSNQLSRILHSSVVRSRQRFLRGFLSWMTAALLPLPPHDKMPVPPSFSTSVWHLINNLWFVLLLLFCRKCVVAIHMCVCVPGCTWTQKESAEQSSSCFQVKVAVGQLWQRSH